MPGAELTFDLLTFAGLDKFSAGFERESGMDTFARSCVLTAKPSTNKNEGTGCGILIDSQQGIIIGHSSVLAPFLLDKPNLFDQLEIASSQNRLLEQLQMVNIEVILENQKIPQSIEGHSLNKYQSSLVNSSVDQINPKHLIKSACISSMFKCYKFERAMRTLMPEWNWKFVDKEKESVTTPSSKTKIDQRNEDEQIYKLLPYFVLLRINDWKPYESILRIRSSEFCRVGEEVELVTTPFANLFPEIMLNSVSKGIISNKSGRNDCLILTDARCMPGSEGGPLYTFHRQHRCLTGIVVSSLCWKSGEWLGFSIACSIHEILNCLPNLTHHSKLMKEIYMKEGEGRGLMKTIRQVPIVKVNGSWGSGIIIGGGRGLVLTCAHVVRNCKQVKLKVSPGADYLPGTVLHASPPGSQFDLAIITCSALKSIQSYPSLAHPKEGTRVFVVGHATFGEEHSLGPSITTGVVSKVITVNNIPVMIQTTCAVHPGASGGALVDCEGRLVGVVVSNAKDSGATFPHINMSVPVTTVWPVIQAFLHTHDESHLKHLYLKNATIDRLWTLGKPVTGHALPSCRL